MQIDSMSLRRGIGHLLDPGLEQRPRVVRAGAGLGMKLERARAQLREVEALDGAVVERDVRRLRRLAKAGAKVTVHPHDVDADTLTRHDGVLLSPGPGDPEPLVAETKTVAELLGRTNVMGICLGHQLIAQATGHETYKLPFGHRGANHPVLERRTGRVLVTSQNHGFAVRASEAAEASHVSLYDGTVEGLDFPELRARSLQFHPEAGPGPHDAWSLIEKWVDEVAA
jgi:carbamoyl-phosphate synthase small subunit